VTSPAPAAPIAAPTRLYDGYLFDLDGTIYLGDELLPGAQRLVELHTDIPMALDAGTDSALVLTGESTRDDVAAAAVERRPTFVLERIDHLLPHESWTR